MASYRITGQYNYEGIVEAKNEKEAWRRFHQNMDMYYKSPEDESISEICGECEYDIDDCECEEEEENEDE